MGFMHIRNYHANCLAAGTSVVQQTTVEHHQALTIAGIVVATGHRLVVAAAGRAALATFAKIVIES